MKTTTLALSASLVLLALATPALAQEPDTTAHVTFGAFVDGYFAYDFNRPAGHDRAFTTQAQRHDEFNVNLAHVEAKYVSAHARGRLALQAGTSVQANYAAEPDSLTGFQNFLPLIQEAYAGIAVTPTLWIDAGIFFSHIGSESWISADNPAYTRSLPAEFSPYYETGVRATWQALPSLAATAVVVNGWQNISETNHDKAAGVRLDWTASPAVTVSYSNFVGREASAATGEQDVRFFNDVSARIAPSGRVMVIPTFDIGTQDGDSWYGASIVGRYAVTPAVAVNGRIERYDDRHGVIAPGLRVNGVSLGIDVARGPGLWRTEVRGLFGAADAIFPGRGGATPPPGAPVPPPAGRFSPRPPDPPPPPDALLARLKLDEERPRGGRLKIFFGANAGVGKTYAMLAEARLRLRDGVDVAVGYVETHRRKDTEALVEGLEVLPRKEVEYRGIILPELDLDAALTRRPALLLVDELAHTNAPGSRHVKRWQDVQELLAAGIDVYSTVNAQHVESLNDLVARITGVRVRETVPDSVFERADEVELVDVSPEELLKRLADGKVYLPEQARRAAQNFFSRPNLTALRQIALRQVADRVDTQMQLLRRAGAVAGTWPVAERILVGVGPAPQSRRIVRAARRMADRLGAEWIALFVETPEYARWPEADRARVWETMRLAEQLGARTATVAGASAAAELLAYARVHNVSKFVVGKPSHPRWRDLLLGSKLDAIVRSSGDVDVYVITGDDGEAAPPRRGRMAPAARSPVAGYLAAAAVVAACTGVGALMFGRFERTNLAMVYLLAVIAVSVRLGRGPSVLAAVLGVAAFDFFFIPPFLTFNVTEAEYLITFGVMLIVALVTSTLTARLREQGEMARTRERRTAALYEMGRDVVQHAHVDDVLRAGAAHVREVFEAEVTLYLPGSRGTLEPWRGGGDVQIGPAELGAARWVFANGQPAGAGTGSLPGAAALYLPLAASRGPVGVIGVEARDAARFADPGQMHFLEAFANHLAVAVERARLAEAAVRAQQMREVVRIKSEFVAVASHELRAPLRRLERSLAVAREAVDGAEATRRLADAEIEARRMRALADDLLYLSRLQAGREMLEVRPLDAEALVGQVVERFGPMAEGRGIRLEREVDDELPVASGDRAAVERALAELLGAALALAQDGGFVLVSADAVDGCVQLSVATSGAEIPPEAQTQVFDAFSRIPAPLDAERTGLGLAIAREIVRAHGGEIWVDSGPGPGAVFSFTLPVAGAEADSGESVDSGGEV